MTGQADITPAEESAIGDVNFDHLTGGSEGGDEFLEEKSKKKPAKKKGKPVSPAEQALDGGIVPELTDPEWTDYVIRQLTEDEKDGDGNPYVHGLRRIVALLLGPILKSKAHVVQAPRFVEGMGMKLQPATVEYTVQILFGKTPDGIDPYVAEYTDVADVYDGNTDPEFARHASAMASTRAEGRCYRKALQLKKCTAAEELTQVPIEEAGLNGLITPTQINFMDQYCRILKIDGQKYINLGQNKYETVDQIPYGTAKKMMEHLATLTNNPSKVLEDIRGYKKDWIHID